MVGKLIRTLKVLQIYKIFIDLMNYRKNPFPFKGINSTSPFSFPKYLAECLGQLNVQGRCGKEE